jgi:predicted esterase
MKAPLHDSQPVYAAGKPLEEARAAMIMLHGRGADAESILAFAGEFRQPDIAYLAPQAAHNTWYPQRFIAPVKANEPWLTSALEKVAALIEHIGLAGIPPERTFLLGFSQGACLALEYAARQPQRYGGLFGLSGALIENGDRPRTYAGSLSGTPVFLGCSDEDFHIPRDRVERSAGLLQDLGGSVTLRLYPGLGHTVNDDEIRFVRDMISQTADR